MRTTLFVIATFLSRRASGLDLRLDIAGGRCNNNTDFDSTFDDGVMPGTTEVMDITTSTLNEDLVREYGFSAFRGDDINNIDYKLHSEVGAMLEQVSLQQDPGHRGLRSQVNQDERDLQLFNCPVFRECPGAGDATHWCAWICGYWHQPWSTQPESEAPRNTRAPQTAQASQRAQEQKQAERRDSEDGGMRFLRKITEDLRIPESELEPIRQTLEPRHTLEPIRYTHEDRQLWISIEGLVCGWIQRWLDSGLSDCLYGSTLVACELDLRS